MFAGVGNILNIQSVNHHIQALQSEQNAAAEICLIAIRLQFDICAVNGDIFNGRTAGSALHVSDQTAVPEIDSGGRSCEHIRIRKSGIRHDEIKGFNIDQRRIQQRMLCCYQIHRSCHTDRCSGNIASGDLKFSGGLSTGDTDHTAAGLRIRFSIQHIILHKVSGKFRIDDLNGSATVIAINRTAVYSTGSCTVRVLFVNETVFHKGGVFDHNGDFRVDRAAIDAAVLRAAFNDIAFVDLRIAVIKCAEVHIVNHAVERLCHGGG